MYRGDKLAAAVIAALAIAGCKPSLTDCLVLCAGDRQGCPRGLVCGADGYCYGDQEAADSQVCSIAMGTIDSGSGVGDLDGSAIGPDTGSGGTDDAAPPIDAGDDNDDRDAGDDEPDAGPDDGCDDDATEPNGTIATARATGIPPATGFHRNGLELCPSGDVDVFRLRALTTCAVSAEVALQLGTGLGILTLELTDSAGTVLANAFVSTMGPGSVSKVVAPGFYYIRLSDAFALGGSTYDIDITSIASPL